MDNNNLIIFKTFSVFVNDLGELYGSKQRSLKLYMRLVNKTTLSHDVAITKHINSIRQFCFQNRDAIISKDETKFSQHKIEYSARVYIDIPSILRVAEQDDKNVIWKHLMVISALVDPAGRAKEILKQSSDEEKGPELDFLTNIINNIEKHVDPNASPADAISSIMNSGMLSEIMGSMNNGFQDGSFDMNKILSSVQQLVSKISSENGEQPSGGGSQMPDISSFLGPMLSGLSGGGSSGSPPDLGSMLGPMMQMFQNMGGNQPQRAQPRTEQESPMLLQD